jgi:HTH-type transcriptional regulator/antitoxin MqsA
LAIAVLDASESKRTMTLMQAFALDQREAAEIFDGGVNAFSRYETGKARPPVALVKLLRVLDRHPELLEEVRAK